MDTGEHIKNNTDDDSQSSAVFGRMRKHKDPLISALNQRVLGSSPSASTTPPYENNVDRIQSIALLSLLRTERPSARAEGA